jgi:hypothetical protein
MERDSLVYKAKLAEQAERFDEMVQVSRFLFLFLVRVNRYSV